MFLSYSELVLTHEGKETKVKFSISHKTNLVIATATVSYLSYSKSVGRFIFFSQILGHNRHNGYGTKECDDRKVMLFDTRVVVT